MPALVKEKWVGVWDFKGEKDSSQEDGKSKCLINKCLPCEEFFLMLKKKSYLW